MIIFFIITSSSLILSIIQRLKPQFHWLHELLHLNCRLDLIQIIRIKL
jgi:hypothetical protein